MFLCQHCLTFPFRLGPWRKRSSRRKLECWRYYGGRATSSLACRQAGAAGGARDDAGSGDNMFVLDYVRVWLMFFSVWRVLWIISFGSYESWLSMMLWRPEALEDGEYGKFTPMIRAQQKEASLKQDFFSNCTHIWLLTNLRCNPHGTL